MVDLRVLRQKISDAVDPKATLRVTRDWLQEVERDLSELAQIRAAKAGRP